ncbi:hypothetical protein AN963_20880 [Brevibacillus choshinensis]|uniref:Uncharacterized protein n=1 Tax=Brevibacillus choshinensis TaxID=54911 RepID=A0ABR5N086_BRECH|nr:hypothetical protein [Brevibacillus choshinensis]KQL43915.1 hypothetical protein AN963_20880 [Brevibacillus choshinensis]
MEADVFGRQVANMTQMNECSYTSGTQISKIGRRGRVAEMKEFHDWNRRVLEALEQTFTYDAKLMTLFVQEGERQNQLYAERLAEFRKKVDEEKIEYSSI